MFKLLISEFKYSKVSMLVVLGIIIMGNIILTVTGQWSVVLIKINNISKMYWGMFVIYYVIYLQSNLIINKINKKRRLRMQKALPLSNYQISLVRIFYFIFLWMFPVIILSFFYTINVRQPFNYQWLQIIGFMSVLYFWYISLYMHNTDMLDLTFKLKEKYLISFFRLLIYGFFFFLNYELIAKINFDFTNLSSIIKQIVHKYLLSKRGIELNLILGIVLIIVSIFTFNKRKSFL